MKGLGGGVRGEGGGVKLNLLKKLPSKSPVLLGLTFRLPFTKKLLKVFASL